MTRPRSANGPLEQQYFLFVEGGNRDGFDYRFMDEFLKCIPALSVVPLGPSQEIRAAARAMNRYHPSYFFLIDRDHHTDEQVERSWRRFPDQEYANLLVWRRRMFENYFLDAGFLSKCPYLNEGVTAEVLREAIRTLAAERLYLDAANMVIVGIREQLKDSWIETLPGLANNDFDGARRALLTLAAWQERRERCAFVLTDKFIEDSLSDTIDKLLGGAAKPEYGRGHWISFIDAKPILNEIIHRYFMVRDAANRSLQGPAKAVLVARSLARLSLDDQPDDFQHLYRMIRTTIR